MAGTDLHPTPRYICSPTLGTEIKSPGETFFVPRRKGREGWELNLRPQTLETNRVIDREQNN